VNYAEVEKGEKGKCEQMEAAKEKEEEAYPAARGGHRAERKVAPLGDRDKTKRITKKQPEKEAPIVDPTAPDVPMPEVIMEEVMPTTTRAGRLPYAKARMPRRIRINEAFGEGAVDRLASMIGNATITARVGDVLEAAPTLRYEVGRRMRPINTSSQVVPAEVQSTEVHENDSTAPPSLVYITIGGESVLAFVDSGSDCNLMHRRTLARLGFRATGKGGAIRGLGGTVGQTERIEGLVADYKGVSVELAFEVTDTCPYPILLGRPWERKVLFQRNPMSGAFTLTYLGRTVTGNCHVLGEVRPEKRFREGVGFSPKNDPSYNDGYENDLGWETGGDEEEEEDVQYAEGMENAFLERAFAVINEEDWDKATGKADEILWVGGAKGSDASQLGLQDQEVWMNAKEAGKEGDDEYLRRKRAYVDGVRFGEATNGNEERIRSMMMEYPGLWGEELKDMRRLRFPPMEIQLKPAFQPRRLPNYPIPAHLLEFARKELSEMEQQGLIERTISSSVSPMFLVKKGNNSREWRLVVDYREVNKGVVVDRGGVANVLELIDRAGRGKIFTKFDLQKGFWQWGLEEKSREYLAFATPFGTYAPCTVPMGFVNSAQGFHANVVDAMGDLVGRNVEVIVDDLLVHTDDGGIEEHLEVVRKVLERAEAASMVLRPSKAEVGLTEIRTWSFVMGKGALRPDPTKVSKIRECPEPRTVRELQSFLQLCNYYRRLVRGFSRKTTSLTELTKGGSNRRVLKMDEDQRRDFEALREDMCGDDVVIRIPDPERQFLVKPDAGPRYVGSVLTQVGEDGLEHPVAYDSIKLNIHQCNYGQTKKEVLAGVLAVKRHRRYLLGSRLPFILVTDCSAFRDLMSKAALEGIWARWVMDLSEYDFLIKYKKGEAHGDADAMSRLVDVTEDEEWKQNKKMTKETWIVTPAEEELPELERFLEGDAEGMGEEEKERYEAMRGEFILMGGRLHRKGRDGAYRRVVWLAGAKEKILEALHDSSCGGHFSEKNTTAKVISRYWWPGAVKDTIAWVKGCKLCQRRKKSKVEDGQAGKVKAMRLFDQWGGDLVGPLPEADEKRYILVWVEHFSGLVAGRAIGRKDDKTIARSFQEDIVAKYGAPRYLTTDRGREFLGSTMREMTAAVGVRHLVTTAYNPQANGKTERKNQVVVNVLSKLVSAHPRRWTRVLQDVFFASNTTRSSVTGRTPFFLVHGLEARFPIEVEIKRIADQEEESEERTMMRRVEWIRRLNQRRDEVYALLQREQERRYERARKGRRVRKTPLQAGDLVWRRKADAGEKLSLPWEETMWKVRHVRGNGSFDLEDVDGWPFPDNPVSGRRLKKVEVGGGREE
jgi:hypothetical protein